MRRSDLISIISDQANLTQYQAEEVIDTLFDQITCELVKGHDCTLQGFGRFSTASRPERQGRHPGTGNIITVAAHRSVVFKASQKLKLSIRGNNT